MTHSPGSSPVPAEESRPADSRRPAPIPLHQAASQSKQAASDYLLAAQHDDGHWVGELEGDSILQSEFILLLAYLGREDIPLAKQLARRLIGTQRPGGGWGQVPGGPLDISASVKAYFALKLTDHDPDSEPLARARSAILAAGGADRVNSFTRFFLALLGQIDYRHCPAVPPEMVLLPRWFPINLYRISAWSRTIFVPLSIVWAHRPVRAVNAARGIGELFCSSPDAWPRLENPSASNGQPMRWSAFFRLLDTCLKFCETLRIRPWRGRALRRAEAWMRNRFADSDGLGAIFPPIVFSVIALDCLGEVHHAEEREEQFNQLLDLVLYDEAHDSARIQPCKSPVWDTALTTRALSYTGGRDVEEALERSCGWLLDREVRQPGDWAAGIRAEPSGWFFEHRNAFYPDVDDTAMVLLALRDADRRLTLRPQSQARINEAARRGREWIVAMQNRDGGWGAFDRDNDAEFLCDVPFADHNAMIDPSTPDLAGRVIEALAAWGVQRGQPPVDRAVRYLRRSQQEDGSWYGRWGVNYIYGTWQVLVGLAAAGLPPEDSALQRGGEWLLAHQQPCGGWGESIASYADPRMKGIGEPTASQTAWALFGLRAAGFADHAAMTAGIRWLVENQRRDGTWGEPQFTGTGFPLVFYLRYHMYPIYFPLQALSQWQERDLLQEGN